MYDSIQEIDSGAMTRLNNGFLSFLFEDLAEFQGEATRQNIRLATIDEFPVVWGHSTLVSATSEPAIR